MELLEALSLTFDHTGTVVAGIAPDQLDAPTPCREWTVRNLVAHTTGVVINMGLGAASEPRLADVNTVALDADLGAQFRAEAAHTLDAWKTLGLDAEVDIGAGRTMPATVGISINLLDTATHSWDIARATGQPAELPDDLAIFVLTAARGVVKDEIRGSRGFDPVVEVADDAGPTDRLVAFLGRRP